MNIYDLKNSHNLKYLYDSYSENNKRRYILKTRFYLILMALLSFLVLFIDHQYYETSEYTIIFFILIIAFFLVKLAVVSQKLIKDASDNSIQSLHDFYFYLYSRVKGDRNRNFYLLKLCNCNILTNQYQRGYDCLSCIDINKLSKMNKAKYYLLKCILDKLCGSSEEFEKSIEMYRKNAAIYKNKSVLDETLEILKFGGMTQIYELIDIQKNIKTVFSSLKLTLNILRYILFVFIYINLPIYLPYKVELRSYINYIGCSVIYLGLIIFPIAIFIKIIKSEYIKDIIVKPVIATFFTIGYVVYIGLLLFTFLFFVEFSKENYIDDNTIEVVQPNFIDDDTVYYCKPYSIFFRKVITYDENYLERAQDKNYYERVHSDDDENMYDINHSYDNSNSNSNYDYNNDNSRDKKANNTEENYNQYESYDENTDVIMGYHKIYAKEFQNKGDTMEFNTSAKGRTYVAIGPEKEKEDSIGQKVKAKRRLVYDRESANGKCNLYVLYEDYASLDGKDLNDTLILNFYAVNKSTGQVITGNKTSWEESASNEYHDATGEW